MKKNQVAKLLALVNGVAVTGKGEDWQIETQNEHQKQRACKILRASGVSVGGFKCGHGGWVLRPNYVIDMRDYGDRSASIHY